MTTSLSLQELAEKTGSTLIGDPTALISGVASLEEAESVHASFLGNQLYLPQLEKTQAGVVFLPKEAPQQEGKNYLINENPSLAFQQVLQLFQKNQKTGFSGIHETATIHTTAQIGENVQIGPHVVIDANAKVGNKTIIGPNTTIDAGVIIGDECHIYSNVAIREGSTLGHRVIIQPGAVIGSCGFGYNTNEKGEHIKQAQVGIVEIQDDVEIGANTTIDRARFAKTVIGQGTKIDNLVQIGHNVKTGKHCIIVSQVGIAGSTTLGNYVVLGGKVAVNGHISICDMVKVGACSAISKSVTEPGEYGGQPILPAKEFRKQYVLMRQLDKFASLIQDLKKRVKKLESNS